MNRTKVVIIAAVVLALAAVPVVISLRTFPHSSEPGVDGPPIDTLNDLIWAHNNQHSWIAESSSFRNDVTLADIAADPHRSIDGHASYKFRADETDVWIEIRYRDRIVQGVHVYVSDKASPVVTELCDKLKARAPTTIHDGPPTETNHGEQDEEPDAG